MEGKKKYKKKAKNSRFLRNAKGFAKQGIFGRGSHIDDEEYKYYINILDTMKKPFEDTEQKVIMANNVFEQSTGKEVHLASNQIVSKIFENLVGFLDDAQLEGFFKAFSEDVRPICSDRFAAHVLQKMIEIAFLRAIGGSSLTKLEDENVQPPKSKKMKKQTLLSEDQYNLETEFSAEHRQNCANFLIKISKFTLNNLEDFIADTFANHILRTCVTCLAGVHIPKIAFNKNYLDPNKQKKVFEVPKEWHEIMMEFPQRLEMWPQFPDLPYNSLYSYLLVHILTALKVVDKNHLKHFGKKLLKEAFLKSEDPNENQNEDEEEKDDAPVDLPMVFKNDHSIIVLENLLAVAGPKLLGELYKSLFEGKEAYLAKQPGTNFAVQKLLAQMKDKEDFEKVFEALGGEIEELLKIGHTGVVSALSAACLNLGAKQAQFIVNLQKALNISNDKEKGKDLLLCLAKLKPYEVCKEDKTNFVHLQGSLIIQNILKFNKPILLVNNILETPAEKLVSIFNTPNGSHIVDAFLESKFIGVKSRDRFIQHLENFYLDMAITKAGSRVVERLYEAASNDAQKQKIVKELADKENMLQSSPFGIMLYNNFRIKTYKLSPEQWRNGLNQATKNSPQDLFKDIIN